MTDAEFLQAFFDGTLPSLSHEDHVRIAWLVLNRQPLHLAIATLRDGFRSFAAAKGKPEVYHETLTWAFIVAINERIHTGHGGGDWREFLAVNPDLAQGKGAIEQFYDRERMESNTARRHFILPTRGC